jgi:hypothetical protein
MKPKKPDIETDIQKLTNRGETLGLMEPMLISESSSKRGELTDLALELASKSTGLKRSLQISRERRRPLPQLHHHHITRARRFGQVMLKRQHGRGKLRGEFQNGVNVHRLSPF